MMERPQRKRNTTRDSREIMRSSLSESTEGLRPQSKRIPRGLEWSTPKGSDFASLEQELDALPVDGFGNDEMFGDMLDDGSADDDLVAHPMFCGTGSRGGGGGGSLSGSGGGRAASGASDSGKASRKGAVVDSAADWDEEEDAVLREAVLRHGLHNWQGVSKHMLPSQLHRSAAACEARWLLVKDKVVKGPWLAEEDALLRELVKEVGAKKWSVIAESIPGRAGKQCRERWLNHLDSAVKKSDWSLEEDTVLLHAQKQVGNRWSEISRLLPGRAENAVKNRFNSLITKRIAKRTASLAARAEMEEQRDQEAEKQAMALTAKLEGKNVLQQLFTIVEPTAAETAGPYASKLASDGTPRAAYGQHAAAAAAFTFGGQPASSSSSSSSPHAMTDGRHSDSSAGGGGVPPLGSGVGRGGLALRLQPPPTEAGDDDDGTQVDLDLMASDGALGAEQLQQAKNFFDHEKERANMFHQVAISSAEFSGMEQLLRARLNAPPSAADQEGGEQWKEPVLVPRVAPLSADPSSRGNNSGSASRSNDKSAGAHGGSSSGKNTGSHRGISASGQQKWAGPRHRRHAEPDSPSSSPTANAAAAGALAPPLRRHRGGGRPGTRGFDSVAAEAESQGGGGLGQNNNNSLGGISVGGNSLSFGSCNNYSNSSSNSRGHAGPQRSRRNGNGSSFDAGGGGGGMRMGVGGAVHDEFDPLLSFAVSPSSDLTGVDVWGGAHNPPDGHSSSTSLHGGGTAAADAASAAADAASVGDSLLGGSLGMGDDLSDSFLGGSFGNGSLGLSFGSNNGSSSSGMPRAGTAAATMAAGFEPSSADHDQSLTAANIGSKLSGMSLDDEHWQQVSASVAAQHQQHHLQAPAGVGASPRGFFDGNAGSLGDGGSLGGGSSSSSSGPGFFGLHPSTSFSFSPRTQPPLEPSRIRGASAAAQHAAATQAAQAALRGAFHNTSDFAAGGGGGSSRNSGRSLKLAPPEMAAPEFSLSPTLGGFSNDRSSVREWPSTTGSGAAIRGGGGGGGYSSGPFRSNSQQSGYGWPVATSPSMSLEDEDWDLLAMGTTPHFTPHGGSSSSNTTAVWPEATTYNAGGASSASSSSSSSRGGDGKSSRFPASRHATAMPSTAGAAGAGASQTAPTPPSTKRPSRAIKLEPAESSSNPSMSPPSSVTPRARALMQLNADFRAGRVTPEDKQRLKQAILEDLAY